VKVVTVVVLVSGVVVVTVVGLLFLFDASPFVYLCRSDGRVALHPSSVNSDEKQFISQWLVYHDKVIRILSIYIVGHVSRNKNTAATPKILNCARLYIT